jgi:hypothetical protein
VAIWNNLPGVPPIQKFKDHQAAATRIWKRLDGLAASAPPQPAQPAKPKAEHHANGGPLAPIAVPGKSKASHKAAVVKNAPKAKQGARAGDVAPRQGSKTVQVVAMLRRKNGATITEIMQSMGWQKHTVRGFMAGAMKKAGHTVESFKSDGGVRTYRIK